MIRKKNISISMLETLDTLIKTQSVSQAARNLDLTQPAISNMLLHLREVFDDDLLIKRGRKMVLTPKAESLAKPTRDILDSIDELLHTRQTFDPSIDNAHFTIAATDYAEHVILPKLIETFSKYNIKLTMIPCDYHYSPNNTSVPDFDLMLGCGSPSQQLYNEKLFTDAFVAAACKHNDLLRNLTKSRYLKARHITLRNIPAPHNILIKALGSPDPRNSAIQVNTLTNGLIMLPNQPYLMTLPQKIVDNHPMQAKIGTSSLPFKTDNVNVYMSWSKQFTNDPKNIWLRNQVLDLFCENK
jgi:LysR family nod box-dependent transcriptional activator